MKTYIILILKFIHSFLSEKKSCLNFACLIIGMLYFILAILQLEKNGISYVFSLLSGIFLATWIITAKNLKTVCGIIAETIFLLIFVFSFIYSLNFLVILVHKTYGMKLLVFSLLSSIGLFYCCVYLLLKCNILFSYFKKIIYKIKTTIFTFQDDKQNPLKIFFQNITAMLLALGSLIIAIKGIIEPIIMLLKNNG